MCACVSAGVGRSGAFIALDCLLDRANAEGQVDVYAFTCSMRKNRANMIQTVVRSDSDSQHLHTCCVLYVCFQKQICITSLMNPVPDQNL